MQAEVHLDVQPLIADLIERVSFAATESEAREAYASTFERLRSRLTLHPGDARKPSAIFESLSVTARALAADCLPLGIAVVMHLYPLCALQCVSLPLFSPAQLMRAKLLRAIRSRSLILANAGGERSAAASARVLATPVADGMQIDGEFAYMSLGSVADIVLFEAEQRGGQGAVLCAADLSGEGVSLGAWKFNGRMRLSDTSSITFAAHCIPRGRYVVVPDGGALRCVADYQRCWFHLFIAEAYLARIMRLRRQWGIVAAAEDAESLRVVGALRMRSLDLLDAWCASDAPVLMAATSELKLRVSRMAQSLAAQMRACPEHAAADSRARMADAAELGYLRLQPTADDKIIKGVDHG